MTDDYLKKWADNEDKNLTQYHHIAKFQAMIFEQMKIFLSDVAEAEKMKLIAQGNLEENIDEVSHWSFQS